jgi:hypothetical protein
MLKPVALFATTIAALHCLAVERALTVEPHDAEIRVISSVADTQLLMLGIERGCGDRFAGRYQRNSSGRLANGEGCRANGSPRVACWSICWGRTDVVFYDDIQLTLNSTELRVV